MNSPQTDSSGRSVTLQDVAREADVAVSTVSRALSNPDRVSRAMRERIQEVARRLGYTSGRAPVRGALLALMVSGIGNPYNAALIRAVESQARAAGSSLIVGDIADGPEVELAHLERLGGSWCRRSRPGVQPAAGGGTPVAGRARPNSCCSTARWPDSPAS